MRLLIVALLIGLLAFPFGTVHAQVAPGDAQAQANNRYVYCNVYLDDLCFGVASGDSLKMEIPMDYVLDTVRLWNGVKVMIYEGNHPEDVFAGKQPKNCSNGGAAYQCRYLKSSNQYDLLYQAKAGGQLIHVHIDGVTAESQGAVVDFLSGFHNCHVIGQSVQCTDDRPFQGID